MRIEQLHYFCETAKAGSINAASERLHISQQSLNTTLKNLEKELNVSLFQTTNRGISITPQGQLLISAAEDILARMNRLKADLAHFDDAKKLSGTLNIQTTPGMSESLLPGVLQSFSEEYPAVTLTLSEHEHLQILRAIEDGSCDLGIFGLQQELLAQLSSQFHLPPHIHFQSLYQYRIVLAVGAQTPLAKYRSISLKTAIRHPFVINLVGDLTENFTYLWLSLYGTPNVKYVTSSIPLYKKIIKSGQAIGLYLGKRHCGVQVPLDEGITLIPLKGAGHISTVGYLSNSLVPMTAPKQALIEALITYCV